MKSLKVLGIFLVLAIAVFLLFIYSGVYNVAVTAGHSALTRRLIETAMKRSVRHHARKIQVPSLVDPAIVQTGALSYDTMCSPCHGAPGASFPEMAQGFDPQPPALAEEVKEWTTAELFWITKHGIKLTGMPAWGPTHSDQELWEIVAFLEKLPTLSPADYQALTRPTKQTEGVMKREEPYEHRHRHRD